MQESDVMLGRIQVFNNWSRFLVKDPDTIWLGLEYFCNEGDSFWNRSDRDIAEFAVRESVKISIFEEEDVSTIVLTVDACGKCQKSYQCFLGNVFTQSFDVCPIVKCSWEFLRFESQKLFQIYGSWEKKSARHTGKNRVVPC